MKTDEKENFLSRWSRLKREQPEEKKPETPAPAVPPVENLPPVEKLTAESDFTGFMHPKVKEELRRLALKKLFTDPHFNIPDPFEPFSRNFNIEDPISPEMLAGLNQARSVLFREEEEKKKQDELAAQQGGTKQDEPGGKDA